MDKKDLYSTQMDEERISQVHKIFPDFFKEEKPIEKFKISIESAEQPEILYHYTSVDVLEKILTDSIGKDYFILRGTNIEYLNDIKELNLAIELLQETAQEFEYQGRDIGSKKLSAWFNQNNLKNILNNFGLRSAPFITSFSENSDSLPMWSMYGNNGNGIAIGSRKSNIKTENNEFLRWGRCTYDKQLFKNLFQSFLPDLYTNITVNGIQISIGPGMLSNDLSFYFGTLKHASFEYEKEWRLMKQLNLDRHQIKFHPSNGILKPFIENKFPKSDLKKIVIGPCADKELSKRSLQMLLQNAGFSLNKSDENFVEVIISTAPYRII